MKKKAKDGSKAKKTPKIPQKTRAREANRRQRKYVAAVTNGKTKEAAKREAGYSEHTKGKEIESSPAVKGLFTQMLTEAGATDELLAQRLREGLDAMDTKFATFEGRITDHEELVSWSERREYLELALKLKGHLIDKHELRMVRTYEEILEDSNGNSGRKN